MTDLGSTPASRRVVCGVLLAGFAGPVVSACGSDSPTGSSTGSDGGADPTSAPSVAEGKALVATSEVPVGGMALVAEAGVIVTQPEAGVFKAFSATCTHQGNKLDDALRDGRIHCSLHGSEFSPKDGAVEMGPATRSLPEIPVKAEAGKVVRSG